MIDDIPEATRELVETKASSGSLPIILASSLSLGAIAFGLGWFLLRPTPSSVAPAKSPQTTSTVNSPSITSEPKTTSETTLESSDTTVETIDNVLGHLPYPEAKERDLVPITSDGSIRLQATAAEKFRQMEADARAQGVILAVISGFRSTDTQDSLFFDVKEQRVQDAAKRAEVSAPPGYSEHHTGYAIDLGDANVPATHLSTEFENTAAFKWLEQNAAKYSFELSFPPNNPQGISYEPWHWRFVGDRNSLETFYKARDLK
jgi:D-alanyl-D-alanine carboxypeptidase